MKNLLSACIIVLGAIFVFGFVTGERADRLRITTTDERHNLTVTVSLFDLDDRYRWVSLHACTADRAEETLQAYCNYFWERESTQETRRDQYQYPFPWRSVPGGLLLITAIAFDKDDQPLAKQSIQVHKRY